MSDREKAAFASRVEGLVSDLGARRIVARRVCYEGTSGWIECSPCGRWL